MMPRIARHLAIAGACAFLALACSSKPASSGAATQPAPAPAPSATTKPADDPLAKDVAAALTPAPSDPANPDDEPHRDGAAFPTETPFARDSRSFTIAPFDGVEFNYQMEKGGSMVYSWKATADVYWDFHGEPKGSKPGFAESYEMGEGTSGNGGFVAPTPGIHGWFWENQGDKPVTVTLTTAGHYTGGVQIMGDGTRVTKKLSGR